MLNCTQVDGFSLIEQFIPMLMMVLAMFCTVPALLIVFKLKGEEKKGHTESLLTRAEIPTSVMGSYVIISIVTSVVMLLLAVVGLWSASVAVMDEAIPVVHCLKRH